MPYEVTEVLGVIAPDEVRRQRVEGAWGRGELFGLTGVFADQTGNPAPTAIVTEMCRSKIRAIVDDLATAGARRGGRTPKSVRPYRGIPALKVTA